MKKVGIIGAGLSSLYAAAYLARNGFEVEVFEKISMPGGRSQKFSAEGFTFDMGPSWYWMPEVIDRLFDDLGEKRSDYYSLTHLDPAYQVFWDDKTISRIPSDSIELTQLFESLEENGGKKLNDFLKDAKIKYEVSMDSFIESPGLKLNEILKLSILKKALKLDMFKSVRKDITNRFTSDKARDILSFPVLFLGERPSKIPSLYTLMNYADLTLGTWYPEGGMNSLALGLESIGKKYGVKYNYNTSVEKVVVEETKAKGLKINGKVHDYDYIIAGADYNHVEQNLIPEEHRRYGEKYWENRRMAPSSLIFYLGLNKKIEKLEHHNLFFDEKLEEHGKEIYDDPKWPSKPLFYICCPSKTDPNVAPEGFENIMVLIPIATDLEDTEEIRQKYLDLILSRINKHCGEDIKEHIVYKSSFCVNDFKEEYNSFKGNAYGLANTLKQTAHLKPKITSKLKNLYFCGQLTVPGPGIPPSLISGKIVAKQVLNHK